MEPILAEFCLEKIEHLSYAPDERRHGEARILSQVICGARFFVIFGV
jgi:hypothetical protein